MIDPVIFEKEILDIDNLDVKMSELLISKKPPYFTDTQTFR